MKESSLYGCVEDFLKSGSFGCFKTDQRVGTSLGIADIASVRDVGGGMRGDIEITAVEVRPVGAA